MPFTILSHSRIEPRLSDDGLDLSLQAPVADPLWFLFRQWQLGEMESDDAGMPVRAQVTLTARPIGGVRTVDEVALSRTEPVELLEAAVEAESVRHGTHHGRLAAEAGAHLIRMLRAAKIPAEAIDLLRVRYQLTADRDAALELTDDVLGWEAAVLLGNRAVDGLRAARELETLLDAGGVVGRLPQGVTVSDEQVAPLLAALTNWLHWFDLLIFEPAGATSSTPPAWDPRRLEYGFKATAGEFELAGSEYDDGELDWSDLVARRRANQSRPAPLQPTISLPVRASYPGMPARRHFEIEDSRVNFAGLSSTITDLGRVLVAEFVLGAGEDWWIVPALVPVGSVVTIDSVEVTDSFGERRQVFNPMDSAPPRFGTARWALYEATAPPANPEGVLTVPPTAVGRLAAPPLERVTIARDEMANMVWAIEHIISRQFGSARRIHRPAPVAPAPTVATYELRSELPAYWLPYLPTATNQPESTELTRLGGLTTDSLIVQESAVIEEEEISGAGVTIERGWQLVRLPDGRTVAWVGRRVAAGTGNASSGLAWDQVRLPSE